MLKKLFQLIPNRQTSTNKYNLKDTIYAPASSPQKAGIIVVRASGNRVKNVIKALKASDIAPRYATLTNIYHPKTKAQIDNCIMIYYEAPHSFTGEDVIEINIHGGKAVLKLLLDALSTIKGLRFAEPGEFSMRALYNGKLDLTQIEGLADLINAETTEQHSLALKQLSGDLGKVYEGWRSKLTEIMGLIEAYIDFPDEDIPENVIGKAFKTVKELRKEIRSYLLDNKVGERLRDGLYVAIVGPTNAGKSSLINKLVKRDVAIVSHLEGTTRDVIEVGLEIKGYPVMIADTAGIRKSKELIECEGVKRAFERAKHADCKIIMLDATMANYPKSILNLIDENSIVVLNKIDKVKTIQTTTIKGKKVIPTVIKKGKGIEKIIKELSNFAEKFFYSAHATPLITRQRHREHLANCDKALAAFNLNKGIEFAAEDLRIAASYLGRITGKIDVESILENIFSNFCIGK